MFILAAPRTLVGQRIARARVAPLARLPLLHRQFRAKAIYSAFPATLHYYSPRRVSSLFDIKEKDSRPDDLPNEGVNVAPDGLVYPGTQDRFTSAQSVSNGAEFRPNTFHMQELTRMFYDQYYLELRDEGKEVEEPQIYTVAKGTQVPGHLMLIHEFEDLFSLQPLRGMPLNSLNHALDEFYEKHAVKENAYDWFKNHPLAKAIDGAKEEVWMAR
ncbi:uncharacterized protein P884DRAFT_252692 [Thermothelomyces heterothallicus CBS 202.75]|uniref:uncharacterized protein n=1 Tax=Thermothelomyces heterothallicus CBS 202.75 TaxID=1149848 RepID=UPI003742ECB2